MDKSGNKKIAIIGLGVMGNILLRSLKKAGLWRKKSDIVFLAVKPQDFESIIFNARKETLVCSVMAGISIARIRRKFGAIKIVRMMPNTPSSVEKGFTVWTSTKSVPSSEKN